MLRCIREFHVPTLFDPIRLGAIEAPNRILMAPLTRGRGTRNHIPTPTMVDYYAQRASAGLLITEATGISQQGSGWPYAPGIWNDEQVAGWRLVTDAVHAKGGRIILQLWHMGRVVHPSLLNGDQPVAPSAIAAPGEAFTYEGKQPYTIPRPLEIAEVPGLIADYVHAARNAILAGFDGVQVHSANGYLLDQFLRNGSNHRTDIYGGSIENRIRLLKEVTTAVVDAVGADRVSVRLSPNGDSLGVDDSDPYPLFAAVGAMLSDIGIAFLEVREPGPGGTFGAATVAPVAPTIRKAFNGLLVLNSDYDGARAQAALDSGAADAIAFGRPFIGNPDLPERLSAGLPLAQANPATWFSQGPEGYSDYPRAEEAVTVA
jgi:N-ethylmaleimide reductase